MKINKGFGLDYDVCLELNKRKEANNSFNASKLINGFLRNHFNLGISEKELEEQKTNKKVNDYFKQRGKTKAELEKERRKETEKDLQEAFNAEPAGN